MIDPITENDLTAYIDGELGAMRRVEVEAHLARHPSDAARVMADLRDRDALREAFASLPDLGATNVESMELHRAARRIDRAIAWQNIGHRLRRAAVIALLVGAGWLAHNDTGSFGVPDTFAATVDPTLVEDAEQARKAVQVRARSRSLRPLAAYDRADLEAATGLELPELPAGWMVRDVQVFPAKHGAGVEFSIDAGDVGELSLFATRKGPNVSAQDTVKRSDDGTKAYWQVGNTSYALTGNRDVIEQRVASLKQAVKH